MSSVASEVDDTDAQRTVTAGSLPASNRDAEGLEVSIGELSRARRVVMSQARAAGLSEAPSADLVLAVDEVLVNSIRHGGGSGTLRIWREPRSVVCEIADQGRISNPMVGRVRPDPGRPGGYGLWLAHQLCDVVQIRSGSEGTRIRLRMSVAPRHGHRRRSQNARSS